MPHNGLGVDQYTRTTAPIRRFDDLVNQIILSRVINQQSSLFNKNQLSIWGLQTDETLKNYRYIENSLKTHWKYKYLQQKISKTFELTAIKPLVNGNFEFNINKINLNVILPLKPPTTKSTIKAELIKVDVAARSLIFKTVG